MRCKYAENRLIKRKVYEHFNHKPTYTHCTLSDCVCYAKWELGTFKCMWIRDKNE